jgi:hypothetical protein
MKVLALLPVICLLAAPAMAQEKTRQVWVTHADSGGMVTGRIIELSKESVALLTPENQRVDIPVDRVLRIEAQGDSLKNGALIGAGVMGLLTLAACTNLSAGECARVAPFQIALGALIGTGIDALNGGRSVIYSRPVRVQTAGATTGIQFKLRF